MFLSSTINLLDIKEETSENEGLENYLKWAPFDEDVKVEDIETEFDKIEGEMQKLEHTEASGTSFEGDKQEKNVSSVKTEEIDIKPDEDEQDSILKDWADEMEFLMEQKSSNEKTESSGIDDQATKKKRKYNANRKTTKCIYCKKNVFNFHRHLIRRHRNETEVQEIEQYPRKSKMRKKMISLLRYEEHFQEYLRGHIIPSNQRSVCDEKDYMPCAYCKAIFSRKNLGRHSRNCEENDDKVNNHLAASQTLIACSSEFGDTLAGMRVTKEVFPIMKADDVSITAKTDPLIVFLGENYLSQRNGSPTIFTCCSNKMRELARLLNTFREKNSSKCTLSDMLDPVAFNHVLDSVKILGGYDEDKQTYSLPSVAQHLRTSLKQACEMCVDLLLHRSQHVRCASRKTKIREVKTFRSLVESQWTTQPCTVAFSNPSRKLEKLTFLSLTQEVAKFKEHALRLVRQSRSLLECKEQDAASYKTLVQSTLALILLTNKRQISDVQYLRSKEYLESDSSDMDETLLSESERMLTKRYKRVTIKRRENRRETIVLLVPVVQECINTLLDVRGRTEVPKTGDYLFARITNGFWTKGETVIRQISLAGGACKDVMLSEKLRRHVTTIMQLLFLNEDEAKELLQFLGCEELQYNPSEDLHQTAKIAKFLDMLDKRQSQNALEFGQVVISPETECVDFESDQEIDGKEEEEAGSETEFPVAKTRKSKLGRSCWSEEEKQAVMEHFADHIEGKIPPKKNETILFKLRHPNLFHDKDWVKIKAFVYNQYRIK